MRVPVGPLRLTVLLVALQGIGLLGAAGFYGIEIVVATTTNAAAAAAAAALALVAGVGLLLVARGLAGERRWARAPALVFQLLVVPVAVGLVQGGRWYVGLPLLGWALVVVALLFSPTVSRALDS